MPCSHTCSGIADLRPSMDEVVSRLKGIQEEGLLLPLDAAASSRASAACCTIM